ncbi:MAG: choice-of-anchor D domain-containing protein, partial [Candidatus Kapaibacterium sp.]
MKYCFFLLFLLGSVLQVEGQITGCDRDPSCTGNMLTIDVTTGRSAEFVDVDNRYPLSNLSTAITFEAWIKPEVQGGKRQFVAGLWGPNQDNNDQWVVYIEDNQVTFELNHPDFNLGSTDNTVVTANIPNLYTRGWVHIAAVWDGSTTAATLYADGIKVGENMNLTYPLTRLNPVNRNNLFTQIGSTNALYDNENRYRTFMGNMDEVRIWNRALDSVEVRCQHILSLRGNEPGLILYYRFNDNRNTATLCDATGNGHTGRLRNGITLDTNLRVIPPTYSVIPSAINTPLNCTADTTFLFRLTDTSFCGSNVTLEMIGRDSALFQLSATSLNLTQNSQRTVSVRLSAQITGDIEATLRVRGTDRCNVSYDVPFNIQRTTELSYSKPRIEFDTLYVGCIEQTFAEDTIEICNRTGRSMQIRNASHSDRTNFSVRPEDPSRPWPLTLAPGDCWRVIVRVNQLDTTRTLYDTLRIDSDDRCPGSGIVPMQGHTQDVIILLDGGGGGRLDRPGVQVDFGRVCPNQISDVRLYQYRNLATDTAYIDSIYFGTTEFFARRRAYPLTMPPMFAFQPDFMRFRPTSGGNKFDSLFVRGRYRGCTIIKKFAVKGYGINVDNGFDQPSINFGNVTVGKTTQRTVNAFNNGDNARFTAYLKVGDAFRITSAKSFQMNTGGTQPVTVEFRPREAITYYDTLCIFDQQCLGTTCIPISGTGVFDALSFDPAFVLLEDVVGCQCKRDTVEVENISGGPLTIVGQPQSSLVDPSGKMKIVGTFRTGTINAGEKFQYIVEYCPNDLNTDRADIGYIHLELTDGQIYEILVRTSSVVPRLFVEPLTTFGIVEAGWQQGQRVLIENISAVPINVTNINLPPGYVILGTTPNLPTVLGPRDSLWVDVEFRPTAEGPYKGQIVVETDSPCDIDFTGEFDGTGKIVRLDVPVTFINFGLNKPCECTEREIPLPNNSDYIPMRIDSIWIDAGGLANANPTYYSWRSKLTGNTNTPYEIPPKTTDTLIIRFCPSGPSDTSQIVHNAQIHIAASGTSSSGVEIWNEQFATTISGRREIFFISNRGNNIVSFGRPRTVGTTTNSNVQITVPDQFLNPSGDSLVITGVRFEPDDRVFTAQANSGAPLPWVITRGQTFRINLTFSPRAPKTYTAKLVLEFAHPCAGIDSTITVTGSGYASNRGWEVAIDTARPVSIQDTFFLSNCDTLVIPVAAFQPMPPEQEVVDVLFHVDYDTTSLIPLDVISPHTTNTSLVDTGDGSWVAVRDIWNLPPGDFAYVRYLVKGGPNAFRIRLDNFDYDSDSLVEYRYITDGDFAWVIVDVPMIAVEGFTDFDTVFVKTCADQDIFVWNPGNLPITFDSLALPPDHRISASSIPLPAV